MLTSVPGMNKKTLESSLMVECIELNDFLPPIAASTQISHNSRKSLIFSMWSEAWVRYQNHMVANFGVQVHGPMADYFLFILEADRTYSWSAITIYDYKHRLTLVGKLSLGECLAFSIAHCIGCNCHKTECNKM